METIIDSFSRRGRKGPPSQERMISKQPESDTTALGKHLDKSVDATPEQHRQSHQQRGASSRRGGRHSRRAKDSHMQEQGDNPRPSFPPTAAARRRRGCRTVGGGGRLGFAASNARPPPLPLARGRKGRFQRRRPKISLGLVAASSIVRRLLSVRGWTTWASRDPVAVGCLTLVCALALSAGGLLAYRALLQKV